MQLTKVQNAEQYPGLRVPCYACNGWVHIEEALVDLQGPSFEYYHPTPPCVPALVAREAH